MTTMSRLFDYDNQFSIGQMRLPVGELRQASELSVVRSGIIREHIQTCDEITYAISGKATVYSGSEQTELTGGQIHFIKQGLYHKIVADPNTHFHYICIGFVPDPDSAEISDFLAERDGLSYCVTDDDGKIRTLSELLIGEFYARDALSNHMVNAYLTQILITLQRILRGKAETTGLKQKKASSGFAIYHALSYINREYLRITSVKSVAQALNYSEYYLSHLFREKMGVTIKEYINKRKILDGAELLKTSSMHIHEIAQLLNFSSDHSFRQAFKRYMGLSPSQYREMGSASRPQ